MSDIKKYPRTVHVRGSRFQHGDHDLEAVPWEELAGKHLIIEEKMDDQAEIKINVVLGM